MSPRLATSLRYASYPTVGATRYLRRPKATHNQGFIEGILGDALLASGLAVERPCRPTSMEISPDENDLRDSGAYPIKVRATELMSGA